MEFPGKVLVIGASGKVGQTVVKELRARNIPVRVLVRSLKSVSHEGKAGESSAPTDFFTDTIGRVPLLVSESEIEVRQGDVTDKEAVTQAMEGVVAVIDVHGVAPLRFTRLSDLWRDPFSDRGHPASVNFVGVQNIVAACQIHGVKHLVRLTGLSVAMRASSPVVWLFNALLSCTVKWHRRSEIMIRESSASGFCYTVVQPSGLRDAPPAQESGDRLLLQCEADATIPTLPAASGIARPDVASLCVAALCSKECKNATLRCVSVPKGKPSPVGMVAEHEWAPLLKTVKPDQAPLRDQNYIAYSSVGVACLMVLPLTVLFYAGKLGVATIQATLR